MKWPEVAFAALAAAPLIAFRFFPGSWCEPMPMRVALSAFVALAAMLYIALVDSVRRPRIGWRHRVTVGGVAGLVVAVISDGSFEVYLLFVLLGVTFGYGGNYLLGWLKHAS